MTAQDECGEQFLSITGRYFLREKYNPKRRREGNMDNRLLYGQERNKRWEI